MKQNIEIILPRDNELFLELELDFLPRVGEELFIEEKTYRVNKISHVYSKGRKTFTVSIYVEDIEL